VHSGCTGATDALPKVRAYALGTGSIKIAVRRVMKYQGITLRAHFSSRSPALIETLTPIS
jgi:hypothetical protein